MKKFKAKIYLKNKKELNEYLKNLVKIKKNPTLEDVKFSFKWGTIPCDQELPFGNIREKEDVEEI